jgi:hypothetical protein
MQKKNLIVGGCSFTEGHNLGKDGSWGYWLANKTGQTLHNLGKGGVGNEFITQKVLSFLISNSNIAKDSIVMIAWTEPTRQMVFFEPQFGLGCFHTMQPEDFSGGNQNSELWKGDILTPHGWVMKHKDSLWPFFSSLSYCVFKTYLSMITLKSYLESNNIPYIFFDAINPTKVIVDKSLREFKIQKYPNRPEYSVEPIGDFESIINNDNIKYIYDENYISFDGMTMDEWLWRDGETLFQILTNGNDGHPNEIASKQLADYILKEYEGLYNKR